MISDIQELDAAYEEEKNERSEKFKKKIQGKMIERFKKAQTLV